MTECTGDADKSCFGFTTPYEFNEGDANGLAYKYGFGYGYEMGWELNCNVADESEEIESAPTDPDYEDGYVPNEQAGDVQMLPDDWSDDHFHDDEIDYDSDNQMAGLAQVQGSDSTCYNSSGESVTCSDEGEVEASCWIDAYFRGNGHVLSHCREGEEKWGLMCYPKCGSGWVGTGAICQKKACPPRYPDAGLAGCWKPAPYGRGWGSWWKKANHQKWGLLWYPKCKSGYHAFGLICSPNCPAGSKDIGLTCLKETRGRGWGKGMICPPGKVQWGILCYDPCREGYKANGAMCWGQCPSNTKRCGALCLHGTTCSAFVLE